MRPPGALTSALRNTEAKITRNNTGRRRVKNRLCVLRQKQRRSARNWWATRWGGWRREPPELAARSASGLTTVIVFPGLVAGRCPRASAGSPECREDRRFVPSPRRPWRRAEAAGSWFAPRPCRRERWTKRQPRRGAGRRRILLMAE